jgi:hypothetical protein
MIAPILISELTNLIQESKRKNQELKHVSPHEANEGFKLTNCNQAAETSLTELKGFPTTSEKQIASGV